MTKPQEVEIVTEHILEIRHAAVGSFLDVRGFVADYIRGDGFLPHWKIDANVVTFLDQIDKADKEGAFAGYKSFGYFTYNPPTKNFFQDRAMAFTKLILNNKDYSIPNITRFGCRVKIFFPCEKDFDSLNKTLNENLINNSLREIVSHKETDLQVVIEFNEKGFRSRLTLGPMHKDEIKTQMNFESDYFSKVGLYMDVDYYKTEDIDKSKISIYLKEAMNLIWEKVDKIGNLAGI